MTEKIPRLLGVVLCGGASSRMGHDKSRLMMTDGTTYLSHALQRVGTVCDSVAVSCREPITSAHQVIIDRLPQRSPAAGIAASLKFAQQNLFAACLFTPVDMPQLTADDLSALKRAWQQSDCLTMAESDRRQPLVGIYPVSLLAEIEQLAGSEQRSLMKWIATQQVVAVTLSPTSCHNVNTPEDLTDGTSIRI